MIFRELGNFDDALLYYDKALSINPTSPRLFQSKAELLYQHGDIPEALEAFRVRFAISTTFYTKMIQGINIVVSKQLRRQL